MRYFLAVGLLLALGCGSDKPTKPVPPSEAWLGTYHGFLYSAQGGQSYIDTIAFDLSASSVAFRVGSIPAPTVTDSIVYPFLAFRVIATPETLLFRGREIVAGRIDGYMQNPQATWTGSWTVTK